MDERRRWGRIIACLCLVFLVGFTFAGCSPSLSQLRKWQEAGAVEPLIVAMKDKDLGVRESAVWALGEIGDVRAVDPLSSVLKDEDVQWVAAEALGKIGDARAVESLNAFLTNREENCGTRREIYQVVAKNFPEGVIKEPEKCPEKYESTPASHWATCSCGSGCACPKDRACNRRLTTDD